MGIGGLMDYKARFYSPYLNQFTQPDTIVPDPINPQSWNRYSYVRNNPINFNDPTGHIDCSGQYDPDCGDTDEQGELIAKPTKNYHPKRDDGDTDTDGDGIPNVPDPNYPLITPRDHVQADCIPGNLVECFYGTGIMPGGNYEITLSEFLSLMDAINVDVGRRDATNNYDFRAWYDTPFYDGGRLKGNLCVALVGCYARNELNYIAQGAASAAAMEGKGLMILSIVAWKRREYEEWPSAGTLRAAAIGHDYYSMKNAQNYLLLITPLRNPVPFVGAVQTHCQPITDCLPTP